MISKEQIAAFVKEYEELCKKDGLQFAAVPQFRARDDGTFSVIVVTQVVELLQETE